MQDQTFTTHMTVAERAVWCSYVSVIREFLGDIRASNYWNLVDVMHQNFQAFGFNHLDIRTMEERYRGRWDSHMMADYCWILIRDCTERSHSWKSYKRTFLQINKKS